MIDEVARLERIAEGREAEIFAYGAGRVLRLFRDAGAHEHAEREAAALAAVRTALPAAPEVFDVVEVAGRPGIIMERIDGRDLFAVLARNPARVWSVGTTTGRLHAEVNGVQAPDAIRSTHERMRDHIARSPAVPDEIRTWALPLLDALPESDRLCHGDFHPGNILTSSRGPVVIDWANATRGHPAADFARARLILELGEPPPSMALMLRTLSSVGRALLSASYRRAYLRALPLDAALVARWRIAQAAMRLVEEIPEERPKLLALLNSARAAP